jgi:hypothetical protein
VPGGLGMLASSRFGRGDGVFRTVSIPRELLRSRGLLVTGVKPVGR